MACSRITLNNLQTNMSNASQKENFTPSSSTTRRFDIFYIKARQKIGRDDRRHKKHPNAPQNAVRTLTSPSEYLDWLQWRWQHTRCECFTICHRLVREDFALFSPSYVTCDFKNGEEVDAWTRFLSAMWYNFANVRERGRC